MQQLCETIMLICFGLSWPISVYKSLRSHSTQGKSLIFMLAILIGYIAGITGKLVGGQMNYVLVMYCFNFAVVSFDLILFIANRRREKRSVRQKSVMA
ncbi:MAG: hypothetical protein E7618_03535 [Ruminococcaceae bacterium]|nr:hypothetical protein [Oscillospiraceae bacterium]